MPMFDQIEPELRIETEMYKRHWYNRRYEYYCGEWRYDWHGERKTGEVGKILVRYRFPNKIS